MDDVASQADLPPDAEVSPAESEPIPLELNGLELDELSTDLCLALARAYQRRGQHSEAQAALAVALRAAYDGVTLADQCAEAALELGQVQQAQEILEARLQKSEAISAYRVLAQVHLARGKEDQARELAERLKETNSTQITALNVVGEVALALHQLEEARDIYATILQKSPTSTTGLLGIARYYAALGDAEAAHHEVASIFAAYGDHPSRWVLVASRQIAEQVGDEDWLADLESRLSALDRRDDQALAMRLRLAGEGRDSRAAELKRLHARKRTFTTQPVTPVKDGGAAPAEPETPEPPAPEPLIEEPEAPPDLLDALRNHFGYESFRPGQVTVIQSALRGEDTLALMPTGAGKSLCYQLPAMLLPGATVLISPLIALMKDQVDNLPQSIRARTAFINSDLDQSEQERRLQDLAEGRLKLVYVAPERLRQPPFIHALRRAKVSLFVIDEAHCISQWGHDFRPDYLFIPKALHAMFDLSPTNAAPPILALTATATPTMREEIADALGRQMRVITTGVFRPNLRYEVYSINSQEDKMRRLVALCRETSGTGIVYARSRESCEKLAAMLRGEGVQAAHYHAGMEKEDRARTQDAWASGKMRVVVATVAFGLGINKADVRFIIHYNLPNSLEAYCQESGRAGRDGRPARCILFYSGGDKARLTQWLQEDALDLDFLRAVYREIKRLIGGNVGLLAAGDLERAINNSLPNSQASIETKVRVGISLLERGGLLRRHFDAPRIAYVTWAGANGHQPPPDCGTFLAAVQPTPSVPQSVDLVWLAQRLGQSVPDVEEHLLTWRDANLLEYRGGGRQMLMELLPAPADSTERLQTLLDTLQGQREAQIDRLADYARSTACRHKTIARHFAERLMHTCGVCDRCAPERPTFSANSAKRRASTTEYTPPSDSLPAEESLVRTILACLLNLRHGVSKTGLARTLIGSIAAPPSGKRSAYYGRLAEMRASRIERAIEELIDSGYLLRNLEGEYPTLSITHLGQDYIGGAG
jgi:ATP-dependent DNA helicase RecQ